MFTRTSRCLLAISVFSLSGLHGVRAQYSVVDFPATAQLVQGVQNMQQQIQLAQSQLQQAQYSLRTMTGDRGMELLLGGLTRNYLPTTWSQLNSASQGGGTYTGLASDVRSAVTTNALMSPVQMAVLAPVEQQQIVAARQAAALRQALAEEALANSSARFAALQSLISAISTAADQKAILDLQTRIGAELGMLQNEQTKLQILAQTSEAQNAANVEREREQAVAGHGRFEYRFQPIP